MSTDKADKAKMNAQLKHIPKDAQVVMSIMKELNINDYEPRIINQLLDFIYRYTTCVLDDAKVYANHARKKTIDLEDVKLATEMVLDKSFTCPPPRHVLSKLCEAINTKPLPPVKALSGLRLPPDRHCLLSCNYKMRAANAPRKMMKSALDGRTLPKSVIKPTSSGGGVPKRQAPVAPKTHVVNLPKPVIKFTTTTKLAPTTATSTGDVKMESGMDEGAEGGGATINLDAEEKMDVDIEPSNVGDVGAASGSNTGKGVKREREEDEFEIVQ